MTFTLPSTPDLTDTMPYHWEMYQLIRHNKNAGNHFFSDQSKRFFRSRWQSTPPYKGRVFVTSERGPSSCRDRRYSVRVIDSAGCVTTVGDFRAFGTRYDAHAYAKAYADENFVRLGNESIRLTVEATLFNV